MSSVCALFSAGIESSLLLWELASQGRDVTPVYVECGFVWEDAERSRAGRVLREAPSSIAELQVLESPVADAYGEHWSLGDGPAPGPDDDGGHYLPGRNLLLLTQPSIYCSVRDIGALAHGTLSGNPFPDASDDFFDLIQRSVRLGLGDAVSIERPLSDMGKPAAIDRADELGVPLGETFSCIAPEGSTHCGVCKKCHGRRISFEEASVSDPTSYADRQSER